MSVRFGGFAVLHDCKHARRIIFYSRQTARKDKRLANRAYRRTFKHALTNGLEAPSEWNLPHRALLTGWDIA